jgi:NADH-quinone oxidoreductase subunit M
LLSSVGLPGLNGCVGEFLGLLGALGAHRRFVVPAVLGVILGAVYLTWMYQRVIFGPITHEENRSLSDLSLREIVVFTPIVVLVFWMGVYPRPLLSRMEPSIHAIVAHVEKGVRGSGESPRVAPVTEAKAQTTAGTKPL